MANRVVHFEIEAQDKDKLKKFYADAFGWEMQQQGEDYGNYVVVMTAEDKSKELGINGGIFETMDGKKEINAYRCTIGVEDINKAMADVKAAGGKVIDEKPTDIPKVGLFMRCEDPEGNRFTLLQPSGDMMP